MARTTAEHISLRKWKRGWREGEEEEGVEVDVGYPFTKIWAPGMMCMPVKDLLERVSLCWGKKGGRSSTVLYVGWVVLFFFLPARFDWSIMGCTILLLALMNLADRKKTERREKQTLNHPAFTSRKIHHNPPQRQNSFAWLNGNISHRVLERGAHNKTATNKRAIVYWLGNPVRDTFNVPYDLFPPLLIKLLITFGCYGHQGDIPQVLSAAWAQENPHHGTSRSPSPPLVFLSRSCNQLHTSHINFIYSVQYPVYSSISKTMLFLQGYHPLEFQSKLQVSKVQDTNGSFHYSLSLHPHLHHSPLWDPHSGCIVGGSAPLPAV